MPTPSYPASFSVALKEYANSLVSIYEGLPLGAYKEEPLKIPVAGLLEKAASGVSVYFETRLAELSTRPDLAVKKDGLICGHIELKAPGNGADPDDFTGSNARQWKKLQAHPNLIYTDGSHWALYRLGKLVGEPVHLPRKLWQEGGAAVDFNKATNLGLLLNSFFGWGPSTPANPRALAEMLAPVCHLLRDQVLDALENPTSPLNQAAQEWRKYLFRDAENLQFADAYAQTITYGLLLAKLDEGSETGLALTTHSAEQILEQGHSLLAQILHNFTLRTVREEIDMAVSLLERIIDKVDPERIGRQGDLWLYFYEDFLAAYDKKLRNDRGVYYTPREVVQTQVHLTSQLLRQRLHKSLAYADDDVTFLDPATGTAAYPVAALQHGLDLVRATNPGNVPGRATVAAKNIHGFEILVGPYAVAHMRLGQMVLHAGGQLPVQVDPETAGGGTGRQAERRGIQIYLADTLDSPHAQASQQLVLALGELTKEQRRAQHFKSSTTVMVCMGNPPYDREERKEDDENLEKRRGGWVRYGDESQTAGKQGDRTNGILQTFTQTAPSIHVKNLFNDYVYFWRWALWKVLETTDEAGIIAFITASSYLRGPGFVGMRREMREAFDELWIIDLEGDALGARKTENVFAIRTPVAIAIGARFGGPNRSTPATVNYTRITGTRAEKLARLEAVRDFADLPWSRCYSGWEKPFLPESHADYFSWPLLTDLFPWQHSGVQFKRTWPIGETEELLTRRWKTFLNLSRGERKESFFATRDRHADHQYASLDPQQPRLPALAGLPADTPPPPRVRYGYRSFDRRWAFQDNRLGDYLRPALWRCDGPEQVFLTSLLTGVLGLGPAAMVSALVPDLHHFRGSFGGKDTVPLWRNGSGTVANVNARLLPALAGTHGTLMTPQEFFCYAYGILAVPAYVERFSEELTLPGPRLPITRDAALFKQIAALGRHLIWLHTFGERFVPEDEIPGEVPVGTARCLRGVPETEEGYPTSFEYDEDGQRLLIGQDEHEAVIAPVSPAVWNYCISDYHVLHAWLSARRRAGAGRRSSDLDGLRPKSWTVQMTEELLRVIWVLEATLVAQSALIPLLSQAVSGPCFQAGDLPLPTDEERKPPDDEDPLFEGQEDLAFG